MPASRTRNRNTAPRAAAKTPSKTERRSHPETTMAKPSKTAPPPPLPSPVRTSGQVTPADKPPMPSPESDKTGELAPDTAIPGRP